MTRDRFEEAARHAVGSALLFRESKNGGSTGAGIDEKRAARLASSNVDGEEMYALLIDVATRAADRAEVESNFLKYEIIAHVRGLAERTDSLALHRFIEQKASE